jgi:hypothetical protein
MSRLTICLFLILLAPLPADTPLSFELSFPATLRDQPFTGRVYVMLSKAQAKELKSGPNWFSTEPFFSTTVTNIKPGQAMILDDKAASFPVKLAKVPKGMYTIHTVMDVAPNSLSFAHGPGNLFSITQQELDPAKTGPVKISLDQVWKEKPFVETDRIKLVDIESKLLTKFHGRSTHLRAGLRLPASYEKNPTKRYPVVYDIPGFSGNHRSIPVFPDRTNMAGVEVIYVVLDPSCHHGHHVFADSENNGPCGQALIEELIPAIDKRFRTIARAEGRIVTGHSSGGWSSLWLQVTYPDFFGACFSTGPDPVDFRDFQKINLYRKGENMFVDPDGKDRPIARRDRTPFLWYKGFSDMEVVMGHGGQLASFEAVFSRKGKDGQPERLWDRKSGAVNLEVAKTWEKYDIRLVLERKWKTIGPKLRGKIHVYMGDLDTFYLEGATALLKQSLADLKGDAVVELFPEKTHNLNFLQPRLMREMAAKFKAYNVVE